MKQIKRRSEFHAFTFSLASSTLLLIAAKRVMLEDAARRGKSHDARAAAVNIIEGNKRLPTITSELGGGGGGWAGGHGDGRARYVNWGTANYK